MTEAFAHRPYVIILIIIFYHAHSYMPPANVPEVLHRHCQTAQIKHNKRKSNDIFRKAHTILTRERLFSNMRNFKAKPLQIQRDSCEFLANNPIKFTQLQQMKPLFISLQLASSEHFPHFILKYFEIVSGLYATWKIYLF